MTSAQYSPVGTTIVSARGYRTVRVWSVATGECVQRLEGHSDVAYSRAFANPVWLPQIHSHACAAWRASAYLRGHITVAARYCMYM